MKYKNIITTTFALFLTLACFALGKDSINAVTMEAYEQGWLDDNGTIALKNNTSKDVHNVTFQITYLDMSGKPLDYDVFTKEIDIAPGMTRQIDIPAYGYDRNFSYYKSEARLSNPHKFKIKYELKGYNEDNAASLANNDLDEGHTGLYVILSIVMILFAIGFCIGLYVLVAYMAKKRNRSQVLWVIVALLTTPLIAIIILLCIGTSYDDSDVIE